MAGDGRSSLRRNARKSSACSPPADRRPRSPDCSRRTARRSAGSTLRRVKPRQSELPGSRYVRKFGRKSTDRVLGPYEQGSVAVARFTAEQPVTALLIAGLIGYGLAYLIHRP